MPNPEDSMVPWCREVLKHCTECSGLRKKDLCPEHRTAYNTESSKRWRESNPERYSAYYRRHNLKKYGLTLEGYELRVELHEGKCGLCLKKAKPLNIDHDHVTGAVRGLVCNPCNMALSSLDRGAPGWLQRVAMHLRNDYRPQVDAVGEDVLVRRAKRADLVHLQALKIRVSLDLLSGLGHTSEQILQWQEKFAGLSYLNSNLRAPNGLYALEVGGRIRATAGFFLKEDHEEESVYALFGGLYCLDPDTGQGSRLMEHRLGVVEGMLTVDFVQCHVHEGNAKARRFVERYGFEPRGRFTEPRLGSTNLVYKRQVET